MDDKKKKVMMSTLMDLKKEMSKLMSNDIKGLKKVTVASPTGEGLEAGLDKAKELVDTTEESEEKPEGDFKFPSEKPEMEHSEEVSEEDMTVEQLDEKIAELQAIKKSKMMAE